MLIMKVVVRLYRALGVLGMVALVNIHPWECSKETVRLLECITHHS